MRIAVGGIHIECSTYSPVSTELEDFRVLRGHELLEDPSFAFLGDSEHAVLPTLHARAIPGGPVSRAAYDRLRSEFLERLAALGQVDGLYLAMHGAMNVRGMDDAEGDWITAARSVVGDACTVSTSYDLHGNVSARIVTAIDAFSTYRTAPHIDVEETQRRAFSLLEGALARGVKPVVAWVPVPVLLPGERTSTEHEPARSLYARLPAIDAVDGVLDASLLVGYVWADEPRATASAVITARDRDVASAQAIALARQYWEARGDFSFGVRTGTLQECVAWARASDRGPAIIADSGDNPTAGGVGDRADALTAALEARLEPSLFAGIADPEATSRCFDAGVGAELEVAVGAGLHAASGERVRVRATVERLSPGTGWRDRQAVVETGGMTVVLTQVRRPFHELSDFSSLGLDIDRCKAVIVKSGYLSPPLARKANPAFLALSPGAVDQHVEGLPVRRWHRPMFPVDQDFAWEPRLGAISAGS